MSDEPKTGLPQPAASDWCHTIAKAGLSALPVVGGPLAELLGAVIAPPLTKRRERWLQEIAQGLADLASKVEGFKIVDLAKNDAFITAVMHASASAVKNHQKEKLEALRNAVLNSALPHPPDDDIQLIFLGWVDSLTPLHLRVLTLLNDPRAWERRHNIKWPNWHTGGLSLVIECALPELRGRRDLYDKLGRDLHNDGLLGPATFNNTMTAPAMFLPQTTSLGKQFLAFIAPLGTDV